MEKTIMKKAKVSEQICKCFRFNIHIQLWFILMFLLVAAIKNTVFTSLAKHRARVKTSSYHREGTSGGEESLVYFTTLSQVFVTVQLGQDMAPCETQASESHFGNTKLDQSDHFKRITSSFPRQIFSLHKTDFSGFRNKH